MALYILFTSRGFMRKYKQLLFLLVILLLQQTLVFIVGAADKPDYFNKFNQVYVYDSIPTLKIEAFYDNSDSFSQSMKKDYEKCMSFIPREQALLLKKRNVVVHLVDNANLYYSKPAPYFLAGFYNPNNNKIFIDTHYDEALDRGYAVYSCGKIRTTLYHEIGHALDWEYGKMSNSNEFKQLFEEEHECYSFGGTKPVEFFANLFRLYTVAVEKNGNSTKFPYEILAEHCPKSSAFVMKTLHLENPYTMEWKFKNTFNRSIFEHFFNAGSPKLPKFLNK